MSDTDLGELARAVEAAVITAGLTIADPHGLPRCPFRAYLVCPPISSPAAPQ